MQFVNITALLYVISRYSLNKVYTTLQGRTKEGRVSSTLLSSLSGLIYVILKNNDTVVLDEEAIEELEKMKEEEQEYPLREG